MSGLRPSIAAGVGASILALALVAAPQAPSPLFSEREVLAGRRIYRKECARCHGARGDGAGEDPLAEEDPRPRDFRRGLFKLRTTPMGSPPLPEDIAATLRRGIPGTSMPAYPGLSEAELRAVTAWVLSLAGLLGKPLPTPVPDPGPAPPEGTARSRGRELYVTHDCVSCHGESGRGDGPLGRGLVDSWSRPIRPRNFVGEEMRGGSGARDVWYRIFAGMNGTPMPPFADAIPDPTDRWALVDYVRSLRAPDAGEVERERGP